MDEITRRINYINKEGEEIESTIHNFLFDPLLKNNIACLVDEFVNCFKKGGKVIFAGNGGSAAEAQHMAAEYVNKLEFDRLGLPAIALSTDTSIITAISNDSDFSNIFSRQLQALGNRGDIFVGYSTSGESENIIQAYHVAQSKHILTVGFTGINSKSFDPLCDYIFKIPSIHTPRVQECHLMIGHIVSGCVEAALFER